MTAHPNATAFSSEARRPLSDHLRRLEAESIEIIREVAAAFDNPVMLYSIGKDSGVMLHLAVKAFYPSKPPFPLLHVDTTWKFQDMIRHRDMIVDRYGVDLKIYTNQGGVARGINPIDSGSSLHTQVMKTEALKQALDLYGFDAAFGGARRDEAVEVERLLQGLGLHHLGVQGRTGVDRIDAAGDPVLVGVDLQVDAIAVHDHVAVADHVPELPGGVDVQQGERGLGRIEGLDRQVQHHPRVLADRIEHDRVVERRGHLADDLDGLGLEPAQVVRQGPFDL